MSTQQPYDPHAAALDALAAMRWPDVSEPPREVVIALEVWLIAAHTLGRHDMPAPTCAASDAWMAGRKGRPLAEPQDEPR